MKGRDLALLTDLYELTMMQGYYETSAYRKQVVFDLFYRKNPSRPLNTSMDFVLPRRTLPIWKG